MGASSNSRWDRYLGMTTAMTQVSVPSMLPHLSADYRHFVVLFSADLIKCILHKIHDVVIVKDTY